MNNDHGLSTRAHEPPQALSPDVKAAVSHHGDDPGALQEDGLIAVVEPLIPALRRYARALLKDRAEADDLVQDCLERTITRWHQRRRDGNTRAWLFTILHNLAVNRARQSARRGRQVQIEDLQDAAASRPPTQEDALRHQDLLRTVERLPDELRSVLHLISIEDLSYAEAAEVLDVPIGTVMSRLHRARERLRREMDEEARPLRAGPSLRSVK